MCALNASLWPAPDPQTRLRRTDLTMMIETDPILGAKLKALGFPHTSGKTYLKHRVDL